MEEDPWASLRQKELLQTGLDSVVLRVPDAFVDFVSAAPEHRAWADDVCEYSLLDGALACRRYWIRRRWLHFRGICRIFKIE